MMTIQLLKQQGCCNTLAKNNEDLKLELPRAWEPLDSSKPSQTSEGIKRLQKRLEELNGREMTEESKEEFWWRVKNWMLY